MIRGKMDQKESFWTSGETVLGEPLVINCPALAYLVTF